VLPVALHAFDKDLIEPRGVATERRRRLAPRGEPLRQLGLRSVDELDSEIDKRDFGQWLHGVLEHFHRALARHGDADLILQRQMPDAQKRARATHIVETLDVASTRAYVMALITHIRSKDA
jgi:hypothetical protein